MWLFERYLDRLIRKGQLTLIRHDGTSRAFGSPDPAFPDLTLRFTDAKVGGDIVKSPRLGLAEAFMDGRAIIGGGDIMDFVKLVRGNNNWESKRSIENQSPFKRLAKGIGRRAGRANARWRSRQNVAHHYDLSAALYDLFLDKDRQYSCAYWPEGTAIGAHPISLDQSQEDKKAHIAAKLALEPGMKVLDIGCGWGGMALYLHRTCGVDVLGVTLSEEQLKIAQQRAKDAGVADHVRFELIDYRDVEGPFDRIVSVGMFEHVGTAHFREFFAKCHDLLTPQGVMLLHTIGRMGGPGSTDAFTDKYIFPGDGRGITAAPLCLHPARMVCAHCRKAGGDRGAVRRALLPHVDALSSRRDIRLRGWRHAELPDPICARPAHPADHSRLYCADRGRDPREAMI
jgi:cyclopropane-fatty-acyl-phospholipid synthase